MPQNPGLATGKVAHRIGGAVSAKSHNVGQLVFECFFAPTADNMSFRLRQEEGTVLEGLLSDGAFLEGTALKPFLEDVFSGILLMNSESVRPCGNYKQWRPIRIPPNCCQKTRRPSSHGTNTNTV